MKNIFLASTLILASTAFSQIKLPLPSPMAVVTQKIGLVEAEVTYSRPGMKDRKIFGALVPFGEIWRLGANESTKIKFSDDVTMAGKEIPAGEYALYAIPNASKWEIAVHKNLTHWGVDGYDAAEDLVRFSVNSKSMKDTWETFTIAFSNFTKSSAHMIIGWENTSVHIPITTKTDEIVEEQIQKILVEGPSAQDFALGARHYLNKGDNLESALEWITKAFEMKPNAFWYLHTKAAIYAKMGKVSMALEAAAKSLEMAETSPTGDYGFVEKNKQLISELNGKK